MFLYDHTPDHTQAFRPARNSHKPSTTSAPFDSDDVTFINCHTDLETHMDYILWADIQQAFDEVLFVTHKTMMLPLLRGPDYQTLEPLRIAAVPGIVLDVVVGRKLPVVDVKIVQDLPLSTLPPSRTTHDSVYGLKEQGMENYSHIERSAISQLSFQGPQVTSVCDQQESDGGYRASTENQPPAGTTSAQKCDGSQENGAATSMDLMQTIIRASQGDADAQVALGDRYKKGDGVDRDRQAALDWYLAAAEQGHAHAQCNIGLLFCADKSMAHIIYDSQYSGASVCDNGDSEMYEDDDIPGDMDKGLEWFLKAAHQGLAAAQYAVALFMFGGFDQANPDLTSLSTITGWFRKAADQNHAMAQVSLARFYGLGLGVLKDGVEAFNLARKAVNRSGGSAESTLGSLYRGSVFIPLDGSTAFEWFVKGAEQGNKNCQYEVAKSYEKGKDIPADLEKAIEWYTKASQNGHPQAESDLEQLTRQ